MGVGVPKDPRSQRQLGKLLSGSGNQLQQLFELISKLDPEALAQLSSNNPKPEGPNQLRMTADEEAAKSAGVELLRAKDLAKMAGVDPYEFRTFLRTAEGGHPDGRYTRYGWDPADRKAIQAVITSFKSWKKIQEAEKKKRAAEREAVKARLAAEKAQREAQ